MLHRFARGSAVACVAAGIAVVLGGAVLAGCQQTGTLAPPAPRPAAAQTSGFVSLNSDYTAFEADMGYRIYLPPGYNADSVDVVYPVVFMLHGFGGSANSLIDAGVTQVAERMIGRGEIEPMILVFPYSGGLFAPGSSFYSNTADGANYESYVVDALLPAIENQYNVDPARVAISGVSMGGYGAMKFALNHPSLFTSVCAHSAPLDLTKLTDPVILGRMATENSHVDPVTGMRHYATRLDSLDFVNSGGYLSYVAIAMGVDWALTQDCSDGRFLSPLLGDPKGYTLTPVGVACPGAPGYQAVLGFQFPILFDGAGGAGVDQPVFDKLLAQDCLTILTSRAATPGDTAYANYRRLRIYMDCGLYDDTDPRDDGAGFNILPQCRSFDAKLTSLGIAHRYVEYAGSHTSQVYYHLDDDLRWHDAAFRGLPQPTATPVGGGVSLRLPAARPAITVPAQRTLQGVAMVARAGR